MATSWGMAAGAFAIAMIAAACARLPGHAVPEEGAPLLSGRPSHLVIGNYCGFGRRYGDLSAPATDRLDAICKTHDACYISGRDRCACNAELLAAVRSYTATPGLDAGIRRRAGLVAGVVRAMTPYCRVFPHGIIPMRQDYLIRTWSG